MWLSLDASTYRRFHNVIIPGKSGTTQIDHLLVSEYGLFIVETKNKTGWIFGSEDQSKWTQTLYKKKYSFPESHQTDLSSKEGTSEYLNINTLVIHTIVYFVGDCNFKTRMPANVRKSGLSRYIRKFRQRILSSHEVDRIISTIQQHISKSSITSKDHIRSLRARHSSNTVCPRCGSKLVE